MGNASGEAWGVNFVNGMRSTDLLGSSGFNPRAVCAPSRRMTFIDSPASLL